MSVARETGEIKWNDYFYYDESSPTYLRHKIQRQNVIKDAPAGNIRKRDGYISVRLLNNTYQGHRVVWELLKGSLNIHDVVDHIDGDRSNNSIDNLRVISEKINQKNKRKYSSNKTGVTGVTYNKTGYYVAGWYENEVYKSKYFSVKKLGKDEAIKQASEYRTSKLNELKASGDEYTERHGV